MDSMKYSQDFHFQHGSSIDYVDKGIHHIHNDAKEEK